MSTYYSDIARMPGTGPTQFPGIQLKTPLASGVTTIADLPENLLRSIFEMVGAGHQEGVCKQFLDSNLNLRFQQGIDLLRMNAATGLLSKFGIRCPDTIISPNDALNLIKRVTARVRAHNNSLPKDIKFSGNIVNLVLDAPRLQEFLQRPDDATYITDLWNSARNSFSA